MERIHRSAKLLPLVVLATLSLGWTSAPSVLAAVPDPTELRAVPREGALVVRWSDKGRMDSRSYPLLIRRSR